MKKYLKRILELEEEVDKFQKFNKANLLPDQLNSHTNNNNNNNNQNQLINTSN